MSCWYRGELSLSKARVIGRGERGQGKFTVDTQTVDTIEIVWIGVCKIQKIQFNYSITVKIRRIYKQVTYKTVNTKLLV